MRTAAGPAGAEVQVEGRLEAFSIGGKLNPHTAVVLIEIANPAKTIWPWTRMDE